jgi:hypothetical protein
VWELALSRRLRPAVHAEIALAEAARAHEIIEARANLGKVVLRPEPDGGPRFSRCRIDGRGWCKCVRRGWSSRRCRARAE